MAGVPRPNPAAPGTAFLPQLKRSLAPWIQTAMSAVENTPLARMLQPTTSAEEAWLRHGPSPSQPGGAAPRQGPTPITTGTRDGVTPDRTQSDQYRAAMGQQAPQAAPSFPLTPQGQFQRYFQSPEMDQYFGAASRGQGAPANLQAMQQLAAQPQAPTTSPLATYYRSQSAAGRGDMESIISTMGYKGTPMEQWAKANPMLAFREYNKKYPAGEPTTGPDDQSMINAIKGGTFYAPSGTPMPFKDMSSAVPGTPYTGPIGVPNSTIAGAANAVPAPPGTQGATPPIADRTRAFLNSNPLGDFFVPGFGRG